MIRIHLHQFRPPKDDDAARDESAAMAFKANARRFQPAQDATVAVLERFIAARQRILASLNRQYQTDALAAEQQESV